MKSKWRGEYKVNCNLKLAQNEKESFHNSIQRIKYTENEYGKTCLQETKREIKKKTSADNSKRRVAVIGAGCSGMTSIVQLKAEGFDPVCFERMDRPGGTWCYKEQSTPGYSSIMPTTVINHSKEMGAYSNFPPAKEYNNYMRHHELYSYLMEYWTANDCLRHVRFNMETTSITRHGDYDVSGRWVVTVRDVVSGQVTSEVFDAVVVCVGHINRPQVPRFPGMEDFKGRILHTHSLKGVEEFRDKRVVVVGIGCSGLDAAVETSNVAKQVYISTKTGAIIMARMGPRGYPMDYKLLRRYMTSMLKVFPRRFCSWCLEKLFIEPHFNRKMYSIDPKYPVLCKDPIINDCIGSKLLSGSVVQKGDISHFTAKGVTFKGDSYVTEADVVIMATGYTWSFPFLEEDVVQKEDGVFNLYKCTFPQHLKHPTLAIVGFLLVWGPGFPVGEMQARWVASVLAGRSLLPDQCKLTRDSAKRHARNAKGYAPNDKMSIRVDYVQYLDEIARLIGARPNFARLFFTDIKLFGKLMFGPSLNYQYRLQGPHRWEGARDAIVNCKERVLYPLRKNREHKKTEQFYINSAFV